MVDKYLWKNGSKRVWRYSLHCAATTYSVPCLSVRCLIHTITHGFILLWERGRKKGGVQHGRKWSSERRADGGTRQDEGVRPSSGEASSPEIHWRENGRSLNFADSAHALKYGMFCNIKGKRDPQVTDTGAVPVNQKLCDCTGSLVYPSRSTHPGPLTILLLAFFLGGCPLQIMFRAFLLFGF